MVKRLIFFKALMALLILGTLPVEANSLQITRLDLYNTLLNTDNDLSLTGFGRARLDFRSRGNNMVRGRMVLDLVVSESQRLLTDLSRASVKFRVPVGDDYLFRVTAGKDRLTWGDGVFFNAGDVIFGSSTQYADFFSDTLRDETVWLFSGFFPLGQFSFFEPVIVSPIAITDITFTASENTGAIIPAADRGTGIGFRFQLKPAGIKVEPGYMYRFSEKAHHPYLSLQGNFIADWYAAVSTTIPANTPDIHSLERKAMEELTISIGLLHIVKMGTDSTLSVRLESLACPEEQEEGKKLLLFPEIIYSPSMTVNTYFRYVISPQDNWAILIPGISWNMYQGFTALAFISIRSGGDNATFSGIRNEFTFTSGFSYIY